MERPISPIHTANADATQFDSCVASAVCIGLRVTLDVCLHWLRVPERVKLHIAILAYKVLYGLAPQYLGPLDRVADLPCRRALRSSGTSRLVVPPVKLLTVANRAFPVVGPRIWNDLPADVTSAESFSTFRQRQKTHLFTKSFPGYFLTSLDIDYLFSGLSSGVVLTT